MFANIYEEEKVFPYLNMSLEEGKSKTFDSEIQYKEDGVTFYSEIE